ncbi:MAG: APC family permease [Candidatus Melainabacteria bacterium]|nr:APC family permease [Candidatus Melainabacteria bacterium]
MVDSHDKTIKHISLPDDLPLSPVQKFRHAILGDPISTEDAGHTLLPKHLALPVFSSDAISSVAYATQQIVLALGGAGLWVASQQSTYTTYTMGVSAAIVALLAIVVLSYWQTIYAYPNGGGSYIVSKSNLGILPGLTAAGALLIDYVLTVSVSIASGIQNLKDVPLFAPLHVGDHLVLYCVVAIALLTIANLRGLKESGRMFALPTYIFVFMCYLMIGLGLIGPFIGWNFHTEYVNQDWPGGTATATKAVGTFGLVVLLRAFANGCSAMTGTEAISNGVPAFMEPKSHNAALTLVTMGIILGTIFLGISWLAMQFHVVYWENGGITAPSVIDQISGCVFGKTGTWSVAYLITQIFTALILVLAANTSFADFPRLSSLLARDGFMPRQLSNLGDKLVFNNGIIALGVLAAILIVIKKGSVDALIPLYAIGVFLAFTLSQAGMVKHWFSDKTKGWQIKATINGCGAIATFLVLIDIAVEKFAEGAWMIMVLIVISVFCFRKVSAHYADVVQQLQLVGDHAIQIVPRENIVLVLVQSVNKGTLEAINYARSLSSKTIAIHVEIDAEHTALLSEKWLTLFPDLELEVLESPYRSLVAPVLRFVDTTRMEHPGANVTIVICEFIASKWWHTFLHGHTGFILRLALLTKRDVVTANVRYFLEKHDEVV